MLDLDGTLVDSVPDLQAAIDAMLEDLDRPPSKAGQVRSWVGNGAAMLVKRALCGNTSIGENDPIEQFDQAYTSFLKHYHHLNGLQAICYPGAQEFLSGLRRKGITSAIITNKPEQFTLPLLRKLSLEVDLVLSGDSLTNKKPHPLPLEHCMAYFGVNPERALMIGDSISDVNAARAANVRSIAVSYGYNHGVPVEQCSPDLIIDSLWELG